jgi:hypothetical protein
VADAGEESNRWRRVHDVILFSLGLKGVASHQGPFRDLGLGSGGPWIRVHVPRDIQRYWLLPGLSHPTSECHSWQSYLYKELAWFVINTYLHQLP